MALALQFGNASYTPRTFSSHEEEEEQEGGAYEANGAIAKYMQVHANQVTGELNPVDVLNARNQVQAMVANSASAKTAGQNLEWEFLGPDNVGGRTRAILFDKDNPSIMVAAGVSGGLFRTTTGASSWTVVNDTMANLNVVSLTQTANGDMYAGTGESMYYFPFGTGAGGFLGSGVWKSTDRGVSWSRLASTIPNASNSTSADWVAVGRLAADPTNGQRVYAATNKGLQRSDDGGQTWVNPITDPGTTTFATDLTVAPDGSVWVKVSNRIFYSPNGDNGTFTEKTVIAATAGQIQRNGNRSRIAVSAQDQDYVYVVTITNAGGLDKVYRSTDRGNNWTIIGNTAGSTSWNPMNNQGEYDLLFAVDPTNKDRIFMGGVTLWDWTMTGGWNQIHSSFASPTNPFYVHVDQHEMVFHPTAPGVLYVGNDGGLFRSSNNGVTWAPVSTNYGTTQFYAVAINNRHEYMGGTQDNGTIYIGDKEPGNTPLNGIRTPGIMYGPSGNQSQRDGDGGYSAISSLDPSRMFKEMQYGVMGRSENGGQTYESFYNFTRMDPSNISSSLNPTFADFVMPYRLWESENDVFSTDSVTFKASPAFVSLGFGTPGVTTYSGVLRKPNPSATFLTSTFTVRLGGQVATSDANGNLTGGGTGTFDPNTGAFTVTFGNALSLEVYATCDVQYAPGSAVRVLSTTNNLPIPYTLTNGLAANDSIRIQDIYQSFLVVGLTQRTAQLGGIWMTRKPLDFSTDVPEWFYIAQLSTGETPTAMEIHPNGNTIWVGTNIGNIYRLDNVNAARKAANADILNGTTVVTKTIAATNSGRAVTGIGLDRNNPNHVMYTLGNYGNTNYVYRSINALDPSPTFVPKKGNLPNMPVYDVLINQFDPNVVLIGTEFGVFSTDNIAAASPVWEKEFGGMPNVPVLMLDQVYDPRGSYITVDTVWNANNTSYTLDTTETTFVNGIVYAATHGRGLWKTGTFSQVNPIGIQEPTFAENTTREQLKLFPNPASASTRVELNLAQRSDVAISVRDLNGKLVRQINLKNVDPSVTDVKLDVSKLANGTYVVSVIAGKRITTGKLVVTH